VLSSADADYLWSFALGGPSLADGVVAGAGAGFAVFSAQLAEEGTYTVTETLRAGWDLAGAAPNDGSDLSKCRFTVDYPEDYGKTFSCTFQNIERGKAQVIKTVSGQPPSGGQSFTFQLRQGASVSRTGTTLESRVATATGGGVINFTTLLVPGQDYQLCEISMPGWLTTLSQFVPASFIPPDGVVANPNVDNSIICVGFTVEPGATWSITVDNRPPPGGQARTIGFWKNWASCATSGGKQKPVLDQTLALFPIESGQTRPGVYVGILYVDTCVEAVRLLDKSTVNTAKKMSSDPAFNLAAQLMAARLNVRAGAAVCGAAVNAINGGQDLLALLLFDGITHKTLTAAQAIDANSYATTLDRYNNNRLCGSGP
ncbi:MAG: hypothetical protein ACREUF_12860, partial [Solimonas sp.]